MRFTHVDKPISLGPMQLKNRVVRPAHATNLGRGVISDELLNSEERADEYLLMGLRLAEGIDPVRYRALSGRSLDPRRIEILRDEGAITVDPDGRVRVTMQGFPVLDAVVAALDAGESIIFFPEGTRGSGMALGAFKSGLFHLARMRPTVPLVPVRLENLSRMLPKGEFLPIPLLGSVTFGASLLLAEGETKDAFLTRARAALEALAE